MKILSKVLVAATLATCALVIAKGGGIDLRTKLTGLGKGQAEWKTQDQGSRLRAELKVQGERLTASTDYSVTVGTNPPFTVTTDRRGEIHSDQRFGDANRPVVNEGDSVTVEDSTDTVVLSGVLQSH